MNGRQHRRHARQGSSPVVHDARIGDCLVWRPIEGPPLPRAFVSSYSSNEPADAAVRMPPAELPRSQQSPENGTFRRHECVNPTVTSSSDGHHYMDATTGQDQRRQSPPRGQLLLRGKGGIDDVLKNARESQRLFYSLQERRLKAEYRAAQQELKADLDDQRQYKRMLALSAFQEELVHLYGPTMRDIIADAFFDDGRDPVLHMLREKRESLPTARSGDDDALLPAEQGGSNTLLASRQLWQPVASLTGNSDASPSARTGRERELLLRALDERRGGRRSNY